MKRLICEADIRCAATKHEAIVVDANTLVTPQAKDIAKELGVELKEGALEVACCEKVKAKTPAAAPHSTSAAEPALSAEEIEKLTLLALERGIWNMQDVEKMAKSLGRHA